MELEDEGDDIDKEIMKKARTEVEGEARDWKSGLVFN